MARSTYLDRIAQEADLDQLMDDLTRVRAAASDAAEKEASARAVRERLEMEAATLERLASFVRSSQRLDAPTPLTRLLQEVQLTPSSSAVHGEFKSGNVVVLDEDSIMDAIAAPPATRKPLSKRGLIAQVMRDQPERDGWSPPAMRAALDRRGVDDTTQLVRVTMRRMAEKGQLLRGHDGLYRLGPALEAEPQELGNE